MVFVEVKGLHKGYNGTKVLEDINFTVDKGEFITLLGPSGCGKSTLLRCIAGLAETDAGEICIENGRIDGLSPKDRDVGMVFQSYALFPNMTVRDNVAFGLKMKKTPKAELEKRVSETLKLVELEDKANSYPSQLSGGQQQRVALARAIVMQPKVLLMDEPLSALDAKIRRNLRMQIKNIQKALNITTLFVTHDQEEAMTISDRIFLMNRGRIVQSGTPDEIYANPGSEFAARFMGSYNIVSQSDLQGCREAGLQDGLYAIRPEAICIRDNDDRQGNVVCFDGVVDDIILLGSIIRYRVRAGQTSLLMDCLNRKREDGLASGRTVRLQIPVEEFKALNAKEV